MSSISSSSLSMSSLIFLPFLASSGFAAPPSPPPSEGFVGRVSFLFCSAMSPSIGHGPVSHRPGTAYARHSSMPFSCQPYGPSGPAKLFTQGQGLMLIGRAEADAVEALRAGRDTLEPDLERRLTVVQHERHLAGPHFHHDLGPEHRAVTVAESGIEEPGVVRANLARA